MTEGRIWLMAVAVVSLAGFACDGSSGAATELVAFAGAEPLAIALDDSSVYWITVEGELRRVDKRGGEAIVVSAGIPAPTQSLALGSDHAFLMSRERGLVKVALDSGDVQVVSAEVPSGYATASGQLYWATARTILRAPATSGTVSVVTELLDHADALAVDDSHVYWVSRYLGTLSRASLNQGDREELDFITGDAHAALALDSKFAYWGVNGYVSRVDKETLEVEEISDEYYSALKLWTDGAHLYTIRYDGTGGLLARMPIDGGEFTPIVTGIATSSQAPPLALDATHVYWPHVPADGSEPTIHRIRK